MKKLKSNIFVLTPNVNGIYSDIIRFDKNKTVVDYIRSLHAQIV